MTKTRTDFRCVECGAVAPKWAGRCSACEAWNTLVEELPVAGAPRQCVAAADTPVPLPEISTDEWIARPTGVPELDRVLGGGLVPGSVTLIGGEPGIGKSTLLLQVAAAMADNGSRLLYVSGEESKAQVRLRAERLGSLRPRVWLATEFALPNVLGHVDALEPDVLIVDSIQTLHDPDAPSAPGSVSQVRDCAQRLAMVAKQRGLTVVLVGHVTKDGALAGPRVLEHLVDTVLSFDGDRHHALRLVRAVKHRFGATCELGLFEMHDHGLAGVPDPSELFLADRRGGVAGSVVVPTVDGHRPMLVELQALVIPTSVPPAPRRSAQGVDGGRLALLLAVLQRRARISAAKADVYASAVGGARVSEPGADLGLALAVASSVTGKSLPSDMVAIGEVGLAGEVRQVSQTPRRLTEAARLGFRRAVVAASSTGAVCDDVSIIGAATVSEALEVCGCLP